MKTIKIVYVGNKPTSHDNVARSGAIWNGKGDIQEVTEDQAKILLKYPDQWALADETEQDPTDNKTYIEVSDENGDLVKIDVEELTGSMEKMTKIQMIALIKMKWNKELPHTLTKKELMGEAEILEAELG